MKYFVFLFFICGWFQVYAQEEPSFAIRGGFLISNGKVPNGNYVFTYDGTVREESDSFDFASGYQFGVAFKYPFDDFTLEIATTYTTNGFKNEGETYKLNYLDVDGTAITYIQNSPAYVGGGIGYAFLLHHENLAVTNKYDVRLNGVVGVKLADNINVFLQGKLGFINVQADSELNNYLFSLNLEYLFF